MFTAFHQICNFWVNFGMPDKSRTKNWEVPAAHSLAGSAVLVAVEGPSPRRGEGKKILRQHRGGCAASCTREREHLRGEHGRILGGQRRRQQRRADLSLPS